MNDLNSATAAKPGPNHVAWARPVFHVIAPIVVGAILAGCVTSASTSDDTTGNLTEIKAAEEISAATSVVTTSAATVNGDDSVGNEAGDETFPDVIAVEATQDEDGSWTFAVTISSPYDRPDRYADAWRVSNPDGEVYGVRELAHDHANEQPFTRTKSGIRIPDDVNEVTVSGRDQLNGWGGRAMTVVLP